jgi:electron transfer flavoprotein beta subunit
VDGNLIRVERSTEEGRQVVTSVLPAVLSLTKDFGEPRYPSFMGIRKAANATIPTWSLADLDLLTPQPIVERTQVSLPPSREVVCEFITGDSVSEQAQALAVKILAEVVK